MSTTGLEVFDTTLHATNIWLNEIMEQLGPDRHRAYQALRLVLHSLRDRLSVEEAAHLSAQLPMLIRGIYYEGWRPAAMPSSINKADQFIRHVENNLFGYDPAEAEGVIRAVFSVLERHCAPGEIADIKHILPKDLQKFFSSGTPEARH